MCNSREVATGQTDECWLEPAPGEADNAANSDKTSKAEKAQRFNDAVDEDAPLGPLNWRVTMNFAFGGYSPNNKSLALWRLYFSRYINKDFSVYFLTHIPMTSPSISEYKHMAFNFGGAWHYLYWNHFEFLLGVSGGLAAVSHLTKPSQSTFIVDSTAGILYTGQIFHLSFELAYQNAKYTQSGDFDLSQFLWGLGFGFKF